MRTTRKKIPANEKLNKIAIFIMLIAGGFLLGINYPKLLDLPKTLAQRRFLFEEIDARELDKRLANKDFKLINVHTPYEGEIAHTDGFIAYDEMKANEAALPKDKSTPIILYCKTGRMSGEAVQTLKSMGYTNVTHLKGGMDEWRAAGLTVLDLANLPNEVLPQGGFELPISWGDIGPRLIALGVIDRGKFEKAATMSDEDKAVLNGTDSKIKINAQNSQFVVDILWALGLAQKSIAYEEGPMGKEYKKDVVNFASTAGWTLARGEAMNYYNKFDLIDLSEEEHKRVMEIASNVYRPCCGNHTAFPDCNHGMAALAAIELMVDAGMSDDEIYKNVLKLNSYWFGSTYLTTATYFARQGISWDKVDAKEVLGISYSSAQGTQSVYTKVGALPYEQKSGGGGCGA
ncbi:hypothetical protein HYT59_01755 [Candidatus Woesebacteria bacterium]|nr:hypothetical protein [Candidatus Woesebacteria bacterium]